MNDPERVTKLAREMGLIQPINIYFADWVQQLLAFEQAVLAKQSKSLEFQEAIVAVDGALMNSQAQEIESLQAKLAMIAEAARPFEHSASVIFASRGYHGMKEWADKLLAATTAAQPTVDSWIAAHDKALLDEAFRKLDAVLLFIERN